MSEVTLLTSQTVYERLHQLADGRAASVKVDRDALSQLLIDHAVLVRALRNKGGRVIEPAGAPLRRRVK